ncbi:uncharacterized protein DUF4353 [Lachnotalea glycerini]|uniref:Uncharacterized protein DUF4353 n=1 Tax=Lachnotalea glycerini TaxID=1763509 RepID=A0A318EQ44_9FIRM|nr:carbohydrate-binding domain-containing protein [Lachnotalea glycerini]PXV87783.1 uncharacterized protein DUF4353 [Lachnotalea glycerini]
MKHKNILTSITAIALLSICLTGCQANTDAETSSNDTSTNTTTISNDTSTNNNSSVDSTENNSSVDYTENNSSVDSTDNVITLNGSSISAGTNVNVDGSTATIVTAGTYEIKGTLDDGQIIVDTADEVTLVLNNTNITCSTSSPLYIKEAENVTITLAEGSTNTITDGTAYDLIDPATDPDAALFSKSDMTINGTGSLIVNANYNDGITSKDTLLIESGNISVTSTNHGIEGKDYLMVNGGSITVNAGGDGIKATNDMELSLGYIEINNGTLNITATDEGISAISGVKITDGSISIATLNNGIKSDGTIDILGGTVEIQTDDDGLVFTEKTIGDTAVVNVNGVAISE